MKEDEIRCCLCGKTIKERESHNAQPLMDGRCCWGCNKWKVVPYRIELSKKENKK